MLLLDHEHGIPRGQGVVDSGRQFPLKLLHSFRPRQQESWFRRCLHLLGDSLECDGLSHSLCHSLFRLLLGLCHL